MLEELIGHVIVFAVRMVDSLLGLVGVLRLGSERMAENSRVGESPMEVESRRWWDRLFNRWFWLSLLLLGIAASLGARADWWW